MLCYVRTGDKFVLKTPDPERLPLPNKDLLELQFYLQRIASLAGLTGDDDLYAEINEVY